MENNTVEIMGMITGIIISLSFFAAIILSFYFVARWKNKERMAIIEKGGDLSDLYKRKGSSHGFFKAGMITIGIAIGLVFAGIIVKIGLLTPEASYFAMILLFGGVAMLLANFLIASGKVGKS